MNDSIAERDRTPTPAVAKARAPAKKPVLASEVLREELAPFQPGGSSCRVILLGTAAALVFLGVALRGGIGLGNSPSNGAALTFAVAGATTAAALLPFAYAWRATLCVALGTILMVVGFRGTGPLAGLADTGMFFRDISRLVALSLLPAALFFRAKYRAYRPARFVLAVAMLASLPFIVVQTFLLGPRSRFASARCSGSSCCFAAFLVSWAKTPPGPAPHAARCSSAFCRATSPCVSSARRATATWFMSLPASGRHAPEPS
jgi:hypothetical protein